MKGKVILSWLFLITAISHLPLAGQTAEGWKEDVSILENLIKTRHPDPWARISYTEFSDKAESLRNNLPVWGKEKVILEMLKLAASIRDGHTQVLLDNRDEFGYWLPVRIEKFSDGYFITAAIKDYEHLVGTKMLKIGDYNIADAVNIVKEVISADGEAGKTMRITNFLTNVTILETFGIIKPGKPTDILVAGNGGSEKRVVLKGREGTTSFNWAHNRNSLPISGETVSVLEGGNGELPLYLAGFIKNTEPFWYEHLTADSIIYLQMNSIFDGSKESITEFTARALEYLSENTVSIQKLVIDLRFNNGGNGDLVPEIVNKYRNCKVLPDSTGLFIITGKETFSAGSILIAQLLKIADFTTVGEIAPGPLNFSSDPVMFRLPNSGLLVNISRLYSQDGHSMDDRGYYAPDCFMAISSDDYFSFRDPVMDAIKQNRCRSLKDLLFKEGIDAFRGELESREEQDGPISNWFPYTAYDLALYTVNVLIAGEKYEEAIMMAELNTSLYPDEVWGWFIRGMIFGSMGNNEEAKKCFGKLLAIEPHHMESLWEMERLNAILNPVEPDPQVMEKLAGDYEGRSVITEEGILKYKVGTGRARRLIPVSDSRYIPEGSNNRILFEMDKKRGMVLKILKWDGTTSKYYRK